MIPPFTAAVHSLELFTGKLRVDYDSLLESTVRARAAVRNMTLILSSAKLFIQTIANGKTSGLQAPRATQ